MNAPLFIAELGLGLGWRADTVVAMTWIYFDESGEHSPSGMLRRLTLGCGISTFSAWQELTKEWNAVLVDAGIGMFHMADFEARAKPFDAWSEEKRRRVLNGLLDIISRHIPAFCGYSDSAANLPRVGNFRSAYQANVNKAFKETILKLEEFSPEPITIVFARHKNIKAEFLGHLFDFFSYWAGDKIKFGGFGDPIDLPPLQVADLVAYEFSRSSREKRPEKERYPLLKLAERAKFFSLYHSSHLGLDTHVWGRELPLMRREWEQQRAREREQSSELSPPVLHRISPLQ